MARMTFFANKSDDGLIEYGYETDLEDMIFVAETLDDASNKIWRLRQILEELQYFLEKEIDTEMGL